MELLSEVLVNNGMKNLKKYRVSQIHGKGVIGSIHKIRHITTCRKDVYLCDCKSMYKAIFTLHDYSLNNIDGILNVPICKTCLNKLPIKVKEEFIYNWTVTKLKVK